MHTCSTLVPATSSTPTTLSGLWGLATSGPSSERSTSTRSSYSAAGVGADVAEVVLTLLAAQPVARLVLGREDRRGRAELGDHVGDRAALGHRQVRGARSGELEDLVLATADAQPAQELEEESLDWTQRRGRGGRAARRSRIVTLPPPDPHGPPLEPPAAHGPTASRAVSPLTLVGADTVPAFGLTRMSSLPAKSVSHT